MELLDLRRKAAAIRRDLLTMIHNAKAGHTGGALSSADILTALYYHVMRVDPANPRWDGRDYFVLSKGHSVEGLFCILADKGFFPKEELATFCQFGTRRIGHPNNKVPGIERHTGALGHGLPGAVGLAKGPNLAGEPNRALTLMGHGGHARGAGGAAGGGRARGARLLGPAHALSRPAASGGGGHSQKAVTEKLPPRPLPEREFSYGAIVF